MSTSAPSSFASHLEHFPLAHLRVIAGNKREKPRCTVRVAISYCLYWTAVDNKTPTPTSLYDFRDQNSLTLERLPATATWEDVIKEVAPYGDDDLSFIVSGRLHGRARWSTFSGEVSVVLTASTPTERNKWMNELRLRISSPQALQERAKTLFDDDDASAASILSLTDEMKALFISDVVGHHVDELKEVPSESVDHVASASSPITRVAIRVHSAVPKVDWIEKINAQLTSWTGFVDSAVKKSAGTSEIVANTAQDVAEYVKFIPGGVSSVFQLVALSARLVVMFAEANRGCRELPDLLAKVMDLLDCVAGSVVPILRPATTLVEAEKILEGNVFQVLVTTFDLSGKIEEQLMRGKWSRLVNSGVVKEVESELARLKQMVVSVALTKQMRGIEVALQEGFDEVWKKIDGLDLKPTEFLSTESFRRPEPSPFFFGRHDELLQLKKAVQERGSAAITGLGGVGKTQMMATFGERTELDGNVPGGVFWVTADGTAEEIVESLAIFAEKMSGRKIRNENRANREVVLEAVRKALAMVEGKWLLCVDNVDFAGQADVNVILGALTSLAARDDGWVVVTSRSGNRNLWRQMKPGQNVILKPLSLEDAMCAMLRLKESIDTEEAKDEAVREELRLLEAGNQIEFEALRELADYLSGLPLAIAQAAAYIRSSPDVSFSDYLQLYRTATKKSEFDIILRRTEDELVPVREEQRGIFSTWQISVDRLSDEAVSVLHAVAILGNAPIPVNLLKEVLNEVSEGEEAHGIRFARVVDGELVCSSSLLHKFRCDGEEWFDIHRLVRLFVLVSKEGDDPQKWDTELSWVIKATHSSVGNLLSQVGKDFYDVPDGHEDRQLALLPHIRSIMLHREKRACMSAGQESVELYHFIGICLQWKGIFSEAEEVYNALLNMQESIHGVDACNTEIALSLHRKGIVFQVQGKLEQAEAMYNKSHEMELTIYGSKRPHPHIASSYHQLGWVYQLQGKLAQSEAMYDKSLQMHLAINGAERPHPDVASSYHHLGIVYQLRGKLDEAEALYNKSLEMRLAIHGVERPHPHLASSYHQLGRVYQDHGKLAQAKTMYSKSLEIGLAIHGTDRPHPDVASTYHQLGIVNQLQGKFEQAEAIYDKSLNMKLAIYGSDMPHPDVAASYHQLGSVYQVQGKLEKAEAMYNKCLEMELSIHGAERPHPDVAGSYHNLGIVYQDQGKLRRAQAMYDKSLELFLAIHGSETPHPDVASSYHNLGIVYEDQGKLAQAEAMYDKSLKMKLAMHGAKKRHPDIATSFHQLGSVYRNQGKLTQAEAVLEKSLEMRLTIHGSERPHPHVASSHHELGIVYQMQGKFEQAEVMHRKSLEMELDIHGAKSPHPNVAASYHNLGNLYQERGKLAQAEAMYVKSLNMRLAIHGSEIPHPDVAASYHNLGIVYEDQGKLAQAEAMYNKSLKMKLAIHGAERPHPDVAASYHQLGNVNRSLGKLEEAEAMYDTSLKIVLAIHGSERPHPHVASSYHQLGSLYRDQGKLKEAEHMIRKCLDMKLAIYGPETPNPSVANTLNSLGVVLIRQGYRKDAMGVWRRALEMYCDVFGADSEHPDIVMVMNNIQRLQNEEDNTNTADGGSSDSADGNMNVSENRDRYCTIQ